MICGAAVACGAGAVGVVLLPALMKAGGNNSGGSLAGRVLPPLTRSTKCIAMVNSSVVSLPSLSKSDRDLRNKNNKINILKL